VTDTGGAADEELQSRTNELMAEALDRYERGEREEALSALDRLQILDENNEAASTFAEHIRAELEQARNPAPPEPAAPAAPTAEPGNDLNHEPLDLGGHEGQGLDLGHGGSAAAAAGPDAFDASAIDDPLLADELAASEPTAARSSALPSLGTATSPKKPLLILAAVLLSLGGAWLAWQALAPGGSASDEAAGNDLTVAGAVAPATPDQPVPAAAEQPGDDPAAEPAAHSAEVIGRIDELMDRGDADFEAGDYAAAVLSYNEALKFDPENEIAKRKIREAGDLFREQKELLEQRATAIQAFNDGDYRNALRIFYRLPAANDDEAARFRRYQLNGWYNMGVRALKSGDCRLARSNLREAQQLDALDPGVRQALEMNAACFEGQDEAYFAAVRGLNYRTLED
jgi:tetratricopeptide (TPR) repeat protein